MENSTETKFSIEKVIEKIYKTDGVEIKELDNSIIVVDEKDCSVIDIDIIIGF